MASRRMKNRLYWAAVKAVADAEGEVVSPFFGELMAVRLYREALLGAPDRVLRPDLERLEERLGSHRPSRDLHDRRLYPHRPAIDAIREVEER